MNIVYGNNTGADVRDWHREIVQACENGGILPEELADVFRLTRSPVNNPDGSPRYVLDWA